MGLIVNYCSRLTRTILCPCSMDQGKMFLFIGVVMILVQGESIPLPKQLPPNGSETLSAAII